MNGLRESACILLFNEIGIRLGLGHVRVNRAGDLKGRYFTQKVTKVGITNRYLVIKPPSSALVF
jgi:hypothetical protein